ncbi:hypothetical protein QBC37DRAFT_379866 [Rhypophila decipiens]|uniref:Uncharacterized protein n=1 Tax=Rhypophila decipiens TaxID=261697 RepID=A0AAN7B2L9_9PEZI|nr:hypothetical protein QBC37DRAFT_379866 [Rhypophila decipiens]
MGIRNFRLVLQDIAVVMLYCTVPSVLLLAAIFTLSRLSAGAPRQPRRRPHDLEMGIDPTTVWEHQNQQ